MEDTKKNEMWGKVMAPLAGFLAIVLVAFLMQTSLTLYISLFFAFWEKSRQLRRIRCPS